MSRDERMQAESATAGRFSRDSLRAVLRSTPPAVSATEAGLRPAAVLFPIVERSTPEQFAAHMRDEKAKWAKVVQVSGAGKSQ